MTVRDARPGDGRRIEEVRIAGWHAAYPGVLLPEVLAAAVLDEERVAWRERSLADPAPGEVTLVGERDGQVVAGAHLRPSTDVDGAAELCTLYVEPGLRGSGLGTALLEAGFARMPQAVQLLWTFQDNAPARRFYAARGFAVDGGRRALAMPGDPVEVRYRRGRP